MILMRPIRLWTAVLAGALVACAAADPYLQTNDLVPSPFYRGYEWAYYDTPGGVQAVRLKTICPLNGRIPAPPTPADSFFDVFYELEYNPGGGVQPGTASGHGGVHFNPVGTGVFETEMLQLDLVGGTLPIMIRESPTLPSRGMTFIQPQGQMYLVDSFFDVFTELSLDGGQTWTPQRGSMRITGTPEPATFAVLGLGAALLARRRLKLK